ncbi:SRPBCC family protein [Azospira inquinata]|uniref:DUF1857 family protein n=1 Tax=Azospira inquinata TaxID=2785627 RepID=A0A975SN60_9RHOO|nr:SRPBCC family protein [Azospira inquinata]QWT45325.1 DUF1857 family protein [Azospira inquinata]QWT49343.1 DUF1857 family protein [Azospira inquinata]
MKFEHLVEINDGDNPLVFSLSRDQLWQGLMCRVEDARSFVHGLEECQILSRGDNQVERLLVFGAAQVRDRVTYAVGHWVRFDTEATEHHAGGSLIIHIEEPEPDRLFLRFTYQTSFAEGPDPEARAYVGYLESAYHAADLDTVAEIRRLAERLNFH